MFAFLKKIFGNKSEPIPNETIQINTAKPELVKDNPAVNTAHPKQNTAPSNGNKQVPETASCKSCGKPVKYNPGQRHIPNYCTECKAAYKAAQKAKRAETRGMVTYTCRNCGKTITLPENVQHWPDLCQECRAALPPQTITRKCRGCGRNFLFPSNVRHWPNYCRECQAKRKHKVKR